MVFAIDNVKAEVAGLLTAIDHASSGDFQLGLVTFKDSVEVDDDLASGNSAIVEADILGLSADGGLFEPEASDEALNTVINGLDEADRNPGEQSGNFDGTFRGARSRSSSSSRMPIPEGSTTPSLRVWMT